MKMYSDFYLNKESESALHKAISDAKGHFMQIDTAKYLKLLLTSASNGDDEALLSLGDVFNSGFNDMIIPNHEQAIICYQSSANLKNSFALERLIQMHKCNEIDISQVFKTVKAFGDLNKSSNSFVLYIAGIFCFEKDRSPDAKERAFKYIKASANLGNIDAGLKLIDFYLKGYGSVDPNIEKAKDKLKGYAKRSFPEAQFKLAECLALGLFGDVDIKKAFKWYKRAADQGNINAIKKLIECYEKGIGTPVNKKKREKWEEKIGGYDKESYCININL